jgi:hypothetical protein
MHRPLQRVLLVLCISLIPIVAPHDAMAHESPAVHVLRGSVTNTQGTLRIDAREGLQEPLGTAWFTPRGRQTVTIALDCLRLESGVDAYLTYNPLFPVVVLYGHIANASGRGSDGKRYRIRLPSWGLAGIPLVTEPHVTTRPAWKVNRYDRGPCGTSWDWASAPEWRRGGILILA